VLRTFGFPTFSEQGYIMMKKTFALGIAAGLISLSACNSTPQEQAADNIEANTEAVADNLEEAADNATTEAGEDALENQADAVRATGQNQAEDMRTNDADTNLSNGL
jgi:peptidoglycan hydrolase CwlO-like protein